MKKSEELQDIANILRMDVLKMTSSAGSGHPSSCLSCAEIMAVLFFNELRYDIKNADNENNDEFILSKGHAAPILYSALFRAGAIKDNLEDLRKLRSNLEGHPIPSSFKWAKVATGSLGQGLGVGVGFSLGAKMQKRGNRNYVLMGDSETAEGSVWEAFQLGSYYKLNNLCAIIDVNKLGQRGETMLGHDLENYEERIRSFGWETIIINGHVISEILDAFEKFKESDKPFAIIAKTLKGKGVSFLENRNGWHGKALSEEELKKALGEIPESKMPKFSIKKPEKAYFSFKKTKLAEKKYEIGQEIATRKAYGETLAELARSDESIIVIDAEVSNSTFSEDVKKESESQFIEAFIAEQNMVGICLGLSKKGFNVFGSSFAAFLSRAHDQIRMSALSDGNFTLCGSHCGVSIGEDGASQMGLEDIAMFRSLPESIVLYPSDAVSTREIVKLTAKTSGIKYIRTTRGKAKVIYDNDEKFKIGDFKVLRESKKDKIVLVGSGITLHEALKAHEILKERGIMTSVIDLYCIKPFNAEKFKKFVKAHGGRVIVAEDHYREGGIGEMLSSALKSSGIKIESLFVKEIPHSGKPEELLEKYEIDSKAIVKIVSKVLKDN